MSTKVELEAKLAAMGRLDPETAALAKVTAALDELRFPYNYGEGGKTQKQDAVDRILRSAGERHGIFLSII